MGGRISNPEDVMDMLRQFRRSGTFYEGASLVVAGVTSSIAFSINTTTQLAGLCYLLLFPAALLLLAQSKHSIAAKQSAD